MNETDFASYVNDNTPLQVMILKVLLIHFIENNSIKLFKWFPDNQMKEHKDKCHLLISDSGNITINVDDNMTSKISAKNSLV